MGLNFPDAPVLDDIYTDAVTGKAYTFDGEKWWGSGKGTSLPPADDVFLPLAGGTMTGAIQLRATQPVAQTESTHKQYVDTAIAAKSLYQGVWQVAANTPDITPSAAILHSYSWIANTVDANNPETAPAALPGIGGVLITAGDTVIWNANTSLYEHVRSPASVGGDFVEVTGDTMTGTLIAPEVDIKAASHAASTVRMFPSASPNGGRIDFQTADGATRKGYIGYGNDTTLMLHAETGKQWRVNGGLTLANNNLNITSGHIDLSLTAAMLDFNGGNGSINFKDTAGGNRWTFAASNTSFSFINQGKATAFSVDQVTSVVNFAGVPTVAGVQLLRTSGGTVTGDITLETAKIICPEGSVIQFNNTACFIGSTANTRIRYDSGDQHNFFIGVSKFLAVSVNGVEIWGTFTDSLLNMPGVRTADKGVNLAKALSVMADQIVALRAEVATLKATPTGRK